MSKQIVNIVANTGANGVFIGNVTRQNKDVYNFFASLCAWGTWGGGTITFYISPDGGTTLIQILDNAYNAVSYTANSFANAIPLGNSSHNNDRLSIWAVLTGATSPNLNVGYYDNNN